MKKFEVQNMTSSLKKNKNKKETMMSLNLSKSKDTINIYIYIERERERERGTILNVERWEENKMSDEEMVIF